MRALASLLLAAFAWSWREQAQTIGKLQDQAECLSADHESLQNEADEMAAINGELTGTIIRLNDNR